MDPLLSHLFSPQPIGTLTIPNRLVGAATVTQLATADGSVSDRMLRLYAERARGGLGLLTVEKTVIHPSGKGFHYMLGAWDDRFIPGLEKLARVIHQSAVPCSLQIGHCGRQTTRHISGARPVAPSAISQFPPGHPQYVLPRAVALEEIEAVIDQTVAAARRAYEAGFDAVELHGAHGYLFHQFLSPAGNQRSDAFGGSTENRCRLLTQIIKKIRQATGERLAILCKIDGEEHVPGGITTDEAIKIARHLEAAGLHGLLISAGCAPSIEYLLPPAYMPAHPNLNSARQIQEAVSIPVGMVGKIADFREADRWIAAGTLAFIGLGRPLLADPQLPRKLRRGETEEIRRCIFCNEKCNAIDDQYIIACAINPALLSESGEGQPAAPAAQPKRVAVIGAGPGGMETARRASERGHTVKLYEKRSAIGGQLNLATQIPGKQSWKGLLDYYEHIFARGAVQLALGEEAAAASLADFRPDVLIIATGAEPVPRGLTVAPGAKVLTAFAALQSPEELTSEVSVIGGQRLAIDTAVFLASRGKQVNLLVRGPDEDYLLQTVQRTRRAHAVRLLAQFGVRVQYGLSVEHIGAQQLRVREAKKIRELPYQAAVIATAMKPVLPHYLAEMQELARHSYFVGDCLQARGIAEAVSEGYAVANVL